MSTGGGIKIVRIREAIECSLVTDRRQLLRRACIKPCAIHPIHCRQRRICDET